MRKGFTVLELLVASLLLGMIMVILTMIFNQSSIAWSTGVASVSDMDKARTSVSDLGALADTAYLWDGVKYIHGIFDKDGNFRDKHSDYINTRYLQTVGDSSGQTVSSIESQFGSQATGSERKSASEDKEGYGTFSIDKPSASQNNANYLVNVMSFGPDRKEDTRYDNIYSVSPSDDPTQW